MNSARHAQTLLNKGALIDKLRAEGRNRLHYGVLFLALGSLEYLPADDVPLFTLRSFYDRAIDDISLFAL
jgi:hypothetical protein